MVKETFDGMDPVFSPHGCAERCRHQIGAVVVTGRSDFGIEAREDPGITIQAAPCTDRLFSTQTVPRTAPPPAYIDLRHHWLTAERAEGASIAEWLNGAWYPTGEAGPVTPEDMYLRGWRWNDAVMVPERFRGAER